MTKVVKEDATEETWKYTYYITDFDGNHLLTLSRDFQPSGNVSNPQITIPTGTAYVEQLTIDAHEVYGSSRLGISYDGRLLSAQGYDNLSHDSQGYLDKSTSSSLSILPQSATLGLAFTRGKKRYELSEHRGNVMVTLSDRRAYTFSMDNFGNPIVEVIPDVRMATDYYPFGKEMHGRKLSLGEYRYGFQGQEGDQETGFWNYKYRMHSPDLGRFFSVDPLAPKYPWNSPYAFSENRLIDAVELEGLEANVIGEITGWLEMKHQQGIIYYELGEKVGLSPREKAFAYLAPYWFGDDGIYQFTPGPSLEVLMNSSQASGYEIGLAVFEFASAGFADDAIRIAKKLGGKSMQAKWRAVWNSKAAKLGMKKWDEVSANLQLHHIIPEKLADNSKLIKKLTDAGLFDIQALDNGIPLPQYSPSKGLEDGVHSKHPEYTKYVLNKLKQIDKLDISLQKKLEEVYLLKSDLTNKIEDIISKSGEGSENRLNEYFRKINESNKK